MWVFLTLWHWGYDLSVNFSIFHHKWLFIKGLFDMSKLWNIFMCRRVKKQRYVKLGRYRKDRARCRDEVLGSKELPSVEVSKGPQVWWFQGYIWIKLGLNKNKFNVYKGLTCKILGHLIHWGWVTTTHLFEFGNFFAVSLPTDWYPDFSWYAIKQWTRRSRGHEGMLPNSCYKFSNL